MKIDDFQSFLDKKFDKKISIDKTSDLKYRNYINANCVIHGNYKIRIDHLKDYGCPKCSRISSRERSKNSFIKRANIKHNNKYNYDNINYITNKNPIEITCPNHGIFKQRPDNHLAGAGCTYCNYKISNDDFIEKCKKIHNGFYNYDKTSIKTMLDKTVITCPNHGDFLQRASSHLSGNGCPQCIESKGEKIISDYLNNLNIEYEKEKKFYNFSKYIEFDFYLPKYNMCIEYDGIQHFEPVVHFGGKDRYDKQIKFDIMKNNFCKNNNINLIRISYKDDIILKLKEYLFKQQNSLY